MYTAQRDDLTLQAAVQPCAGHCRAGPVRRIGRWIPQRDVGAGQGRGGCGQLITVAHVSSAAASSSRCATCAQTRRRHGDPVEPAAAVA